MSGLVFKDGQTVVFVGDSITDCGRRAEFSQLGSGYVKLAVDLIGAKYPARRIQFYNEGIGGNTVEDLRNRWHDDVLRHKPDWLLVKIGINDIHRTLSSLPTAVPVDKFEKLYRECLDLTRRQSRKTGLILIDPFYISTDVASGSFRSKVLAMLTDYLAVVRKLAKEYDAIHVRTHDKFLEQLRHKPADYFCPEPVHPYVSGHLVIAHAVLEAIGW